MITTTNFKIALIGCFSPIVLFCQSPQLIKDIFPGEDNSNPGRFSILNDTVYFFANDGVNGLELWRTDATEAGTYMVKDIGPGTDPHCKSVWGCGSEFVLMDNIIYFRATDAVHGSEIWRSDGTDAGTYMVKDINPGSGDCSNSNFMSGQYFAVMDSILYFAADGGGNNIELWRSNGTEDGTYLVKDFAAGESSIPEFITHIDGSIYFRVKNADGEPQLWKSDGTDAGSVLLKQMWVRAFEYTNMFIEYDGYIYFAGDDDDANDLELWRTDGTPEGTELFINLNTNEGKGSNPHEFHVLNGKLLFTARPANLNDVLFISDGTPEGTLQFPDNSSELTASFFIPAENKLYFEGDNGVNDGLWVTDGTSAGTLFLLAAGPEYFATAVTGNNIVYSGTDEENGCYALFQSNGTVEGTFQPVECEELSYPSEMIAYKGKVLLNGASDAYGSELWQFSPEFDPVDPGPGTGIADNMQQHELFIYPNPAIKEITIKHNNLKQNQEIFILNSLGEIVLTSSLQSQTQTIDISDLAQGVYFIRVEDSIQKLVVK